MRADALSSAGVGLATTLGVGETSPHGSPDHRAARPGSLAPPRACSLPLNVPGLTAPAGK